MKYKLNDLKVDAIRQSVMRGDVPIELSDLSWRVFLSLIENAPLTVTYDRLAKAAWYKDYVSADTMTQRIKVLRHALGDDAENPRYIATDRGVGYRLIALPELISAQANVKQDIAPQTHATLIGSKAIAGASLVLMIAIIVMFFTGNPYLKRSVPTGTDINELVSVDVSADDLARRGYEYLSRGTRDANEQALSFFTQALDITMNHQDSLIGQSFANSHRVTKYDFDIEAAVNAEALARKALAIDAKSGAAWHALGFSLDAQSRIEEALRAYEQAIAINPDDHNAVSSAAYLLQVQGRLHEALLLERGIMRQGKRSQFTFLQIASALHLAGFDEAANRWLNRAETLTPDTVFLNDLKMSFHLSKGDFVEAKRTVLSLTKSRSASLERLYGEALMGMGENEEALAAFSRAIALDENEMEGAFQQAALEILQSQDPQIITPHPLIDRFIHEREAGDQWPHLPLSAAYIYAARGEVGLAITHISEAYQLGYRDYNRLKHSPFLKPLQAEPAFEDLLDVMKKDVEIQNALIKNDERLIDLLE